MGDSIVMHCEIMQEFAGSRKHKLGIFVEKTWLLREILLGGSFGHFVAWQRGELFGRVLGVVVRVRR